MTRECSTHEKQNINACRALVGKPEEKRALGTSRMRLEDNIKVDFREIGWGAMDWIHLAQHREK
jgi:hypothetical protein